MNVPRRTYAWDLAYKFGSGSTAPLVVCADSNPGKCSMPGIEGSISLNEFEARLDSIPTDREIVFYCYSPQDAVAIERAAQYQAKGFTRVQVLNGGIEAWNAISVFRAQLDTRN